MQQNFSFKARNAIYCLAPEGTGLTIATASNWITAWISLQSNSPLQQAGDVLQYWCNQFCYAAQS